MGWPYRFIDLTSTEKQQRREALDRYALYAQFSALAPVAIALIYRAAKWALKSHNKPYSAVPNSPSLKSRRLSAAGGWSSWVRQLQWWLEGNLVDSSPILGRRDRRFHVLVEKGRSLTTEQNGFSVSLTSLGCWYSACWKLARVRPPQARFDNGH